MSTLIESTFVTLDGVISSPADWGAPYWNDEHSSYGRPLLFGADALLLSKFSVLISDSSLSISTECEPGHNQ